MRIKSWFKLYHRDIFFNGGFLLGFFVLLIIATKFFTIDGTTSALLNKNKMMIDWPLFKIGEMQFFQIAWYAVFIIYGLLVGVFLQIEQSKRMNLDPGVIWDGLLIVVPIAILGTRAYYVMFGGIPWSQFFNFQDGGLAIHGGIISAFLAIIVYTKVKKQSFFAFIDIVVPAFLIGQLMGRWGNYMNGEAHGPIIENHFVEKIFPAFIFNNFGTTTHYHPTFLYESLWNFLGLVIIYILRKIPKSIRIGDLLCFYLVWYGIGRGMIEPFRTDALMVPGSQENRLNVLMSGAFIALGVIIFFVKRFLTRKNKMAYYSDFKFYNKKDDLPKEVVQA